MLNHLKLEKIVFIDIETVPQQEAYDFLPDSTKELWDRKAMYIGKENESSSDVYNRAGIYAEFGKIVCISAGLIVQKSGQKWFRIKSFFGNDEKEILIGFAELLKKVASKKDMQLCAHNGKEFDFPYLSRRMLINGIALPAILSVAGKKPWETQFLDTLELWKFGDYKNYTSLKLLANIFNIPSPKDDIDGSKVAEVYYKEKNIERIVKYCEKDVLTVAQLFLKFKGEDIIKVENIEYV